MTFESAIPQTYDDLKAYALSLIEALQQKSIEVESLKFQLLKLNRWRFGKHSEQLNSDQLVLWQAESWKRTLPRRKRSSSRMSLTMVKHGNQNASPKEKSCQTGYPESNIVMSPPTAVANKCSAMLVEIGEEISE